MYNLLTVPPVAGPGFVGQQRSSPRRAAHSAWPACSSHPSAAAAPCCWSPTPPGVVGNAPAPSAASGVAASAERTLLPRPGSSPGAGAVWPGVLSVEPLCSSPPSSGTGSGLQGPPHLEKDRRSCTQPVRLNAMALHPTTTNPHFTQHKCLPCDPLAFTAVNKAKCKTKLCICRQITDICQEDANQSSLV